MDIVSRSSIAAIALAIPLCSSSLAQDIPADSPIAAAVAKADAAVAKIIQQPSFTFQNTALAIDDVLVQFEIDTSMTQFMAYVSPDAAERDRGALAEEHYNNWLIELGKNEKLYHAVKTASMNKVMLDPVSQRLLDDTLRDYRRAGMELPAAERDKLKTIQKEIARLSIEFEKNIRNDATTVPLTREELAGMPTDWFSQIKESEGVYLVGMEYPSFNPIMDLCENQTTRQKVWTAYKRRGGQANVQVLEQILKLRTEAAHMLGYQHPADYETEILMSKNAAAVNAFYDKLRPLVRAKAKQDWNEYVAAKRAHTLDRAATLYPWDQSFYEKRLQKEKYAVDSELVREYFPMQRVVDGLFSITQSLYGITYKDITENARSEGRKLWHEDVKLYEVWDKASNTLLGEFYLDLYPRENKYSHAAQWGLVPRKRWSDGRIERPLAALVCNFTKPTPDKPSLLSHDEVETFFHEFGHCLHTILTTADVGRFAGTGVERDFVEAPSQMFENWVWDSDVLRTFSRHYQTNEPLPEALLEGMVRARHLGSGLLAEHQFYYGLVDQTYHTDDDGVVDTTKIGLDLFGTIELYQPVPQTFFQASFGHLTGYQAGYYGYQWSLVYAQDMFQRFKELGMLDPKAGAYYREKILARGGTLDAMDMVRDYLQREPSMEPYLEHLGLKTAAAASASDE